MSLRNARCDDKDNLNVILYLSTCHTVYITVLILFMIMPQLIINTYVSLKYELKKKMEWYWRVNLLGPGPRLMKKESTRPQSHKGWETLGYSTVYVAWKNTQHTQYYSGTTHLLHVTCGKKEFICIYICWTYDNAKQQASDISTSSTVRSISLFTHTPELICCTIENNFIPCTVPTHG